jgi:glycosyltransferase involved in cell wall biosynthesis
MNPLVSISCITFNHIDFIKLCLDGFLSQRTKFKYEIVIHDDASNDGTIEVIEQYRERYPEIIFPMYQSENQYSQGKYGVTARFNFPRCRGKYIALCEGDDYWTDPYKLQKQVDFLEANPKVILCYHRVNVLFTDGKMEEDYLVKGIVNKNLSNIYDMAALGNYIHTPSVVFRNVIKDFPPQYSQTPINDYFLYMLLGQYGDYYRLEENMGVYRYGVGSHSSKPKIERSRMWLNTLQLIQESIGDPTVSKIVEYRIAQRKLFTLPKILRSKTSYLDLARPDSLVTFTTYKQLLQALYLKVIKYLGPNTRTGDKND